MGVVILLLVAILVTLAGLWPLLIIIAVVWGLYLVVVSGVLFPLWLLGRGSWRLACWGWRSLRARHD